ALVTALIVPENQTRIRSLIQRVRKVRKEDTRRAMSAMVRRINDTNQRPRVVDHEPWPQNGRGSIVSEGQDGLLERLNRQRIIPAARRGRLQRKRSTQTARRPATARQPPALVEARTNAVSGIIRRVAIAADLKERCL